MPGKPQMENLSLRQLVRLLRELLRSNEHSDPIYGCRRLIRLIEDKAKEAKLPRPPVSQRSRPDWRESPAEPGEEWLCIREPFGEAVCWISVDGITPEIIGNLLDALAHWDVYLAATDEGGKQTQIRKKSSCKTAAQYNVEADKYLREHPEAGPRELRKALGCGMGTVYRLPAYLAVAAERKKGRKPKAVSLTKPMAEAVTKGEGELAKLIGEQQRNAKTYKVGTRERM